MARPILPTRDFDLLGLDRWTLLSRMQVLANQAIPEWTDFTLGHPENVLLEAQALLVSVGCSNARELARQMYFSTVTRRLSLIRRCKPLGYNLPSGSAALVDGVFSLLGGGVTSKQIDIPIGTRLLSGSATYTTLTAGTLLVGASSSGTVSSENAEQHSFTISSPGNVANWFISLTETPYLDRSVVVVAAGGAQMFTEYKIGTSRVWRSFLEMTAADLGFIVVVDDDGAATILFGNGMNGAIPQGTVQVQYKSGGGEDGRVSAGASWQILDPIYDSDGQIVSLTFTNPLASVGGFDQMSVEEGRLRAPLQRRVFESAVNESDAETLAEGVAAIARSACTTSEQVPGIPEDEAWLYLVAYGSPYSDTGYYPPASPTAAQVAEVQALFDDDGPSPSLMNTRLTAFAATFYDISVAVRIYKTASTPGATTAAKQAAVKLAITQALQRHFAVANANRMSLYNADWGYNYRALDVSGTAEVAWSDIFEVVAGVPYVRKIPEGASALVLNGSPLSVTIPDLQFARLGAITVYDMDEGGVQI